MYAPRIGASSAPRAHDGVGEVVHRRLDLGWAGIRGPAGGGDCVQDGVAEGRVGGVVGVSVGELGLHVESEDGVAVGDGGAEGVEGGVEQGGVFPVGAGEETGAGHHGGRVDVEVGCGVWWILASLHLFFSLSLYIFLFSFFVS